MRGAAELTCLFFRMLRVGARLMSGSRGCEMRELAVSW